MFRLSKYFSAALRASASMFNIEAIPIHCFLLMTPPFDALMMSCSSKNHPIGILKGGGAHFLSSTCLRINVHTW